MFILIEEYWPSGGKEEQERKWTEKSSSGFRCSDRKAFLGMGAADQEYGKPEKLGEGDKLEYCDCGAEQQGLLYLKRLESLGKGFCNVWTMPMLHVQTFMRFKAARKVHM